MNPSLYSMYSAIVFSLKCHFYIFEVLQCHRRSVPQWLNTEKYVRRSELHSFVRGFDRDRGMSRGST